MKNNKKIKGEIGYYGLEDWWLSAFSSKDRKYIETKFQPLGSSGGSLTSKDITYSSQTAASFLSCLAGWFSKKEERYIAYIILDKAEELSSNEVQTLNAIYIEKITLHYKDRDIPGHLDKAIQACKKQIAIASKVAKALRNKEVFKDGLPRHTGFEQLAIILEKNKNYKEAIEVCVQANHQGWGGDWEKRIARCQKKLIKS